nr:uncharacterized protein LOC106682256 [Halyomorpha halys]
MFCRVSIFPRLRGVGKQNEKLEKKREKINCWIQEIIRSIEEEQNERQKGNLSGEEDEQSELENSLQERNILVQEINIPSKDCEQNEEQGKEINCWEPDINIKSEERKQIEGQEKEKNFYVQEINIKMEVDEQKEELEEEMICFAQEIIIKRENNEQNKEQENKRQKSNRCVLGRHRQRRGKRNEEKKKKRDRRNCWVKEINKHREELGEFHLLFNNLIEDGQKFFEYFQMSYERYCKLHQLIAPEITKQFTTFRRPVSTEERLAVCLRFLATGVSFRTLALSYRLGRSTVSCIIYDVCKALWKVLHPIVMPVPEKSSWEKIENDFRTKWNFPNCVGAIGGKHVETFRPDNKNTLSMVLLGLSDADYKFITVDVVAYDRNCVGGIFSNSELGKSLLANKLSIPDRKSLPGSELILPHVVVADEAFPLHENVMRPYPEMTIGGGDGKQIFNYRLSRARQVLETCFKMISDKFQLFHQNLQLSPENSEKIILAACVLHNFLRDSTTIKDKMTVSGIQGFADLAGVEDRASSKATSVRDSFMHYFVSPLGFIEHQYVV